MTRFAMEGVVMSQVIAAIGAVFAVIVTLLLVGNVVVAAASFAHRRREALRLFAPLAPFISLFLLSDTQETRRRARRA